MRKAEINGRHVVLEGFKNVKLADTQKLIEKVKAQINDCCIQLFDPSLIAGFDHLYFATLNALKAFDSKRNISKDLAVEVLLYASGQHQISKAIQLLGIKPDSREVAVLAITETYEKATEAMDKVSNLLKGERCNEIFKLTEKKIPKIKSAFNIKKEEIGAAKRKSEGQAVLSLLIERAALLATQA
jgi:KEOPS complex subunit Cgi121